jgi:sulfur carrier protein ThiS
MSIRVKVKLFGRKDKESKWVSLGGDSRHLRTLLEDLSKDEPTQYIQQGCITIVNKEIVVDDVELSDGDEIEILPMVQGG